MSAVLWMPAGSPREDGRSDLGEGFERWRVDVRGRVLAELSGFLRDLRISGLDAWGVEDILMQYVTGGKCLRSTLMYLGWLCGAGPDGAALRAAASLELLHAFALLQDDVMDDAVLRRGASAAHVRLAEQHRRDHNAGSAARFGASAATLLGDMCLVWAEQMLRDSGVEPAALARVWPGYDAMRIELAVGQFADLINDVRDRPDLDDILAIARAKSGNYTVRRPLELGAAMAGCGQDTLSMLARFGTRVGEAFQLRDDLLGIFGSAAVTGKPADSDLGQHKATSVVVVALEFADPVVRDELLELMSRPVLDRVAIDRCRALIAASGAPAYVEAMIADRVEAAMHALNEGSLDAGLRVALEQMALLCTARKL
ncbi:geranylgeranyl diphosphate synthase, type I [Nocardia amikacinitolerans]|nr:geranylgeranyl diphosphate synthase, type I [Nocardia amikacinitolerans]MCP2298659.1 geranylgeranyl diphosphate synthase, type I [Nocardia amikacinitolerans]